MTVGLQDLFQRYQATEAALDAYVSGLPLWVNVWRGWMFFVFGSAVLFLVRPEARWVALTMLVSLFAYDVVAMFSGVGRFPSIALVPFWSPLAVLIARRRRHRPSKSRFDRVYSGWLAVCLVTLTVSIVFDVYNVAYSMIAGVP